MKKLYYLIAFLGFAAIVLAAMASDSGTDLPYTMPPAIIGALLLWYGTSKVWQINRAERRKAQRIHKNRSAYRAMLLRRRT